MPKLALYTIFILLPLFTFSQYTITGKIVDKEDEPIEFATAILQNQDSAIVGSGLSSELGIFEIEAEKGNYILTIVYFGKTLFNDNIVLFTPINLGTIQADKATLLQEITVTEEKRLIEKKVDRLVFNVENSTLSSGVDVLDILRITPRIKVQNENVSMVGKSGMMVMLDDRIVQLSGSELAEFLKSLRSDEIKSIEVITNPPAKYSAEGNSGIINIVTKKQRQDAWNITLRSSYQQATYATGQGGAGLNLKKNKIELSTNLNYTKGSTAPDEKNIIEYDNKTWIEKNKRHDYTNALSARTSLDYKISDKVITGFSYHYLNSRPNYENHYITMLTNPESSVLDSLIVTKAEDRSKKITNILNYNIVYNIDSLDRKLSFDFDYFDFQLNSNYIFHSNQYYPDNKPIPLSFSAADNNGIQKITNSSFNLDMEHPFDFVELNYGGRLSFLHTDNTFEYYDLTSGYLLLDTLQSNRFEYEENTRAVYVSAEFNLGDKWETQVGFRVENTSLKGYSHTLNHKNKSDYTQLFPTVYFAFYPNDDHSISIDFNRRIDRPEYHYLNPFQLISSPYSYSVGNPLLQPAFSNNLELEYLYKDLFMSSFYFSYIEDEFEETVILNPETNTQQIIPLNFLTNKTIGYSQTIMIELINRISLNLWGDISYSDTKSKIPTTIKNLSGWNSYFALNGDFNLNKNKTLKLNITYSYVAKGIDNLDTHNSFNMLSAMLRAYFFKNQLTVSLFANDILASNRPTYTTYFNGIKNSITNYYDYRSIRFSLTYKIGKPFEKHQREARNKEEINRTN